ncbi:MAG: hypothetical protein CVV58_04935 [Tenericutes bacterium HGW-Tenericutes-3]|nr:MAG: hypothetical protein CVV58_04935 [Tenericutes bacterium HGW-Tenericutes-3]
MSQKHQAIKDSALIAVLASILFVQQLALSFLPNVQFTTLLIVLYTKVIGFKKTTLVVILHVLAINILSPFGPVIIMQVPAMLIGWLLIPVLLHTVFRKLNTAWSLAIFGFFFGFVYGWLFIPVSVWILDVPFLEYLIADVLFEIVMAISNFLTILWLYDPLKKLLADQKERYYMTVIEPRN